MPKICEFGIRHSSSGGHKNYGIKITAAAATTTAGVAQDHTENLSRRANLMRCWNFKLRNQVKSGVVENLQGRGGESRDIRNFE